MLRSEFARNGYVVFKGVFSDTEVQALKDEAAKVLAQKKVDNSGVSVGMAVASPKFKEAAAHPKLVESLRAVIGDHIIFLSDKIVFKDADTDFGSPWHQDWPYWKGSHKYSVWIALDDATPENGCLRVVAGSHLKGGIDHTGDASDGLGFSNRLTDDNIDESQIVDLPAARGDAIVFHDLLFHASYPNETGKDRWALISTYRDGSQPDPDYPWAKAAFTVSE